MGHKIAAVAASAALATSGLLGLAAPAQAATSVEFCFVFPNGVPWAGLPVGVEAYGRNGWERVGEAGVGNVNGCQIFNLYGDYNKLTVRAYAQYNVPDGFGGTAYIWSAATGTTATPGTGHVHLGTTIVFCTPNTLLCP